MFTFDIIYFDPPYNNLKLIEIIPNLLQYVSMNGILIYERAKKDYQYTFTLSNLFKVETRLYGKTILDLFTYNLDKT